MIATVIYYQIVMRFDFLFLFHSLFCLAWFNMEAFCTFSVCAVEHVECIRCRMETGCMAFLINKHQCLALDIFLSYSPLF